MNLPLAFDMLLEGGYVYCNENELHGAKRCYAHDEVRVVMPSSFKCWYAAGMPLAVNPFTPICIT